MSQKGTLFRQMSLTESFGKVKRPPYRFPKPTMVSAIRCVDDSDSELETPLSGQVKRPLYRFPKPTVVSAILCVDDSDSELETPLSESNDIPGSPNVKNCAETSTTDSPCSVGSDSSDQTMIYDYLSCVMDTSINNNKTCDLSTSPSAFPLSGELITNDPNNFVSVNTQSDGGSPFQLTKKSSETRPTKSAVKRKLFEGNNSVKITKSNNKEINSINNASVGKENSAAEEKNKSAGGSVMSPSNVNTTPRILQNIVVHTPKQSENSTLKSHKQNNKSVETVATTAGIPQNILTEPSMSNNISTSTVKEPFLIQSFKAQTVTTASKTTQKHVEPTGTVTNHSPIKKSPSTPKKTQIIDQHQPSTSKTPVSSPSKSTSGSPKRKFRSPSKDSPRKYRELKSLKAKDGKRLQILQLNELVRLFKEVTSNIHLRRLLNSEEHAILKRFEKMEDDQKYFVMKLFIWKKSWYNIFKFCTKAQLYITDDDKSICEIFEYLREEEFVYTDYKKSEKLLELIDQLDIKDLKEIMTELRIPSSKGKKRQNLIDAILTAIRKQRTLTKITLEDRVRDEIEKKMGFAVKIRDDICQAFFHAYTLATFTNNTFDDVQAFFRQITEFRVVFPETNLENYPVFYSREKFVLYAKALKTRRELDDILGNRATSDKIAVIWTIGIDAYNNLIKLDQDDYREHTKAPHLKRFSAQNVYCSVLSTCCANMYTKNNGKPNEVKKWLECLIKQFPDSRKLGDWYHRLIWLHMKHLDVINYETAAKMLIDVLKTKSDRLTERVKLQLAALACRLKSSKIHKIEQLYHDQIAELAPKSITDNFPKARIDCHCIRSDAKGRKRIYIKKGNQEMTTMCVEDVALHYYSESGFPGGKHCEGSLIKALLMLYFWDIIYNPEEVIAATFISRLQVAPLDMFTRYFYESRRKLIHRRLMEIESEWSDQHVLEFATENWRKHSHELNPFGAIEFTIPDTSTVEVLVTVLGRKVMAKVFERLIKDLKENSSGMPDLLVWNFDQKTHKFVEVKGESDRLAPNQLLWLDYLRKAGASIEVCLVHSRGSKRKLVKNPIMGNTEGGGEDE